MKEFENVKKALEEKTEGTENYITLAKNVDARHSGKYTTMNMVTRNTSAVSYKTLDEVVEAFNL